MRLARTIFLTLLISSTALHAQAAPRREADAFLCLTGSQYFLLDGSDYRKSIATLHALHSRKDMLRICNDALNNHHFFLRDIRHRSGVCRLSEFEIFPIYTAQRTGTLPRETITSWSDAPPKLWASKGYSPLRAEFEFATDGPCPRADDPSYVPATEQKP